jgi:hypothetical protein
MLNVPLQEALERLWYLKLWRDNEELTRLPLRVRRRLSKVKKILEKLCIKAVKRL